MPACSFKLQYSVARMLPFIQARCCLEPKGNLCVFSSVSVISGSAVAPHKPPSVTMTLQRLTSRAPGEMRGSKWAWAWHSGLPRRYCQAFRMPLFSEKMFSPPGVQSSDYIFHQMPALRVQSHDTLETTSVGVQWWNSTQPTD